MKTQLRSGRGQGSARPWPAALMLLAAVGGLMWSNVVRGDWNIHLLKDIAPGVASSSAKGFVPFQGKLFFQAAEPSTGAELWVTDGTEANTQSFLNIADDSGGVKGSSPEEMTEFNGKVYFSADDGLGGRGLWATNGTAGDLVRLNLNAGQYTNPRHFTIAGAHLFFSAAVDGLGTELCYTDGAQVSAIDLNPASSSYPADFVVLNDKLYFTADDGSHGREVWISDGTTSSLLADLASGPGTSFPTSLAAFSSNLYFEADAGTGSRLWQSSGVSGDAQQVKAITGAGDFSLASRLTPVGATLFMASRGDSGGNAVGVELWSTDGSPGNLELVKDIMIGPGNSNPSSLTPFNGKLFFAAAAAPFDNETWISDGTGLGTMLLVEINPGLPGSAPGPFFALGGWLFFAAQTALEGRELWATDGTTANTQMVANIYPDVPVVNGSSPGEFSDINGRLIFAATTPGEGRELWAIEDVIPDTPPAITEGPSVLVTMSEDGIPTPFSLTLHATDPDGDTLTWSVTVPAEHGTASVGGTGTSKDVAYVPALHYVGSDSFGVTVDDGRAGTAFCTVNVMVEAPNQPPDVVNPGDQMNTEGDVVSLQVSGSDPELTPLMWSAQGLPGRLSMDEATGLISGLLANDSAGDYVVTVTASDGELSATVEFNWTVAQREPADINGDGRVNAVDVQLVINAALSIPIDPFHADINGDGRVDAVDVQLVINAALDLLPD